MIVIRIALTQRLPRGAKRPGRFTNRAALDREIINPAILPSNRPVRILKDKFILEIYSQHSRQRSGWIVGNELLQFLNCLALKSWFFYIVRLGYY